jgi:uncharacterized membrane protein YqjE
MADSFDTLTHTARRVVDDVRELFREEVALARAEIRQEMSSFASAAIKIGVGAIAGLFAVLFVLHAFALGLAAVTGWSSWIAYLAVGVLLGIVAAVAIAVGMQRARLTPSVPRQTIDSLQENKEWLKRRMSSEPR